ncbi:MAG: extracellular solute-binding protein [Desulfobacterales bacterium]|nr:extracellular solute-binding protein [Desulfobacterales bacterium]MCP4164178.1 extracellular solute-binding protein [Deltaproteobacteria bacterium]
MLILAFLIPVGSLFASDSILRVFTWEGYVIPKEVEAVNKILIKKGYKYKIKVIKPWAEGPEQMFKVLRSSADISFLTLNYIKMQNNRIARVIQPINIKSPRLTNYKYLLKSLTNIGIGMKGGKHLYVPWGGGAYGLWANMKKLKKNELPVSVKDLWKSKWKGKISLAKGQVQPNLALTMLSLGKTPFYLNDIVNNRSSLIREGSNSGKIQKKTNALYSQVGKFWDSGPEFTDQFLLVASYGPGASAENAKGGKWKLLKFKEGNTVWLDTINFHKNLKGKKLEAAEIFLNYFIGKKVQTRVVKGLGMVATSSLVKDNVFINENPDFFQEKMFWPPYDVKADNVMLRISKRAMKANRK